MGGLFDELLGNAVGTQGDERTKTTSSLVQGLLDLLDEPDTGGIQGLSQRSQSQGLGDVVASWIGTGGNRSITPDQVSGLLGSRRVQALGQSAGLAGPLAAGAIAALLPVLLGQPTAGGKGPAAVRAPHRGRATLRDC